VTPAVHSYATVPPMDAYEALIAEYTARGPRRDKGV
jgi:hypothetical protein